MKTATKHAPGRKTAVALDGVRAEARRRLFASEAALAGLTDLSARLSALPHPCTCGCGEVYRRFAEEAERDGFPTLSARFREAAAGHT